MCGQVKAVRIFYFGIMGKRGVFKMDAVKAFIKKETVLCAAVLVAVMSMFFVPPSLDYLRYIDFRVLILLLCLMLAVAGLRSVGVFEWVIGRLLSCVKMYGSWFLFWY